MFEGQLCLAEFSLSGPDSHAEIEPFARTLLDIATDAGSPHGQAVGWLMLGESALFAGRLSEASTALRRAVRLTRSASSTSGLALAYIRSAEADIARGKRWQASRLLDQAMAIGATSPLAPHLLIRGYAARGAASTTPARASAVLEEAERDLRTAKICQPCSIGYQVATTVTRARSGDLARARQHFERVAAMWQGGPWQAAMWEARGVLRIAEGDRVQGEALLAEAAARFAQAGRPIDAARCRENAA